MSYQVIARKYRPQRFIDVVGQEHVTRTLANAIARNRIAHAYLFCGPRGTGKTTVARIFAKCLNCTNGPAAEFPDDDPRCVEITEGRSLDVMEIDGASNRGIEEIRALRETVHFAPAGSRFRIYIIDEVHMLTKEAFNALLKTLEEPPAHVKFMFATTEPDKVLPTILSRCQRFDLRRIPTPLIAEKLAEIALAEGIQADARALLAVARGSDGGMRDAQSTLDQLISFCGNRIEENDALSMFGLASQDQIFGIARAILEGRAGAVLSLLDQLAGSGRDLQRLLNDLLSHFRNLLIYSVAPQNEELIEATETERGHLRDSASLATPEILTRILDLLTAADSRLRDASSRRIVLEVFLLRATDAAKAVSIDQLLKELASLRGTGESTAPTRTPQRPQPAAATPAPAPATLPAPPPSVLPPPVTAREMVPVPATPERIEPLPALDLQSLWQSILDGVGRASPFSKTYLLEAHPVSLERKVLTLGFAPEVAGHIEFVDNSKIRTLIHTKLSEAGHRDCQVRFIKADRPAGYIPPTTPAPESVEPAPSKPAAPSAEVPAGGAAKPASLKAKTAAPAPPQPISKESFKDDPLIRQALEIFKGTIVEVRG